MQIRDYVESLVKAERNGLAQRLTIDGVNVWPIFRAQTISMFRNPAGYFKTANPHQIVSPGIVQSISAYFKRKKLSRDLKSQVNALPSEVKSARVLFFSRNSNHTDLIGSKYIDRFCDPFYDYLRSKGVSCAKIELSSNYESSKIRKAKSSVFDETIAKQLWYFSHDERNRLISGLTEVPAVLETATGLKFGVRHLQSALLEIWYYRMLFSAIFEQVKPEVVFYKCYYEHDAAGLTLAARAAGITTVDIQHGKQGEYHPMYSHFTTVPDKGYDLLPDFFWNWGEPSAKRISETRSGSCDVHVPVVGGNLWLSQWKAEIPSTLNEDMESLPAEWNSAAKRILFTLQPLDEDEMVPDSVKDAIRCAPSDWLWLIRRHPMQKLGDERIIELLGNPPSERVNIKEASRLPLYQLLKITDHHITQWSSVVFEAGDFGVKSTITGTKGASVYSTYLAEGMFGYAGTGTELINSIQAGPIETSGVRYIETSETVIHSAMERLNILKSDQS